MCIRDSRFLYRQEGPPGTGTCKFKFLLPFAADCVRIYLFCCCALFILIIHQLIKPSFSLFQGASSVRGKFYVADKYDALADRGQEAQQCPQGLANRGLHHQPAQVLQEVRV